MPAAGVTITDGVILIDHPEIEAGLAELAVGWNVGVDVALGLVLYRSFAELSSRPYLVAHGVGDGTRWWWVSAHEAGHINDIYPGVTVRARPPDWWNEEQDSRTPRLVIGDGSTGLDALRRR